MGGVQFDVRSSDKVRYLLSAQLKGRLRDRVDQSGSCTRKGGSRVYPRGLFPEDSTKLSRNESNDSVCATLLTYPDGLRSASVSLQNGGRPRQADLCPRIANGIYSDRNRLEGSDRGSYW